MSTNDLLISSPLPLALPALAVIALYAFANSWNEFLFALLLISSDSQKTIPSGLAGLINGDVFQWGALMAGALLSSLPPVLIYILAQKWVVSAWPAARSRASAIADCRLQIADLPFVGCPLSVAGIRISYITHYVLRFYSYGGVVQ